MTDQNKINSVAIFGNDSSVLQLAVKIVNSKRKVLLFATTPEEIEEFKEEINFISENLDDKITFTTTLDDIINTNLIIDIFPESNSIKKDILGEISNGISDSTIYASDIFFESVTSFAENNKIPERIIGTHFNYSEDGSSFVEIIPGVKTPGELVSTISDFFESINQPYILSKDSPGFIVEKLNQIYLGEAVRIFEEELADATTIDWMVKQNTLLEIGPLEKLDLTGINYNLKISEFLYQQTYNDSRFKPSLTLKRMVEANHLGYKTKFGFYDYHTGFAIAEPHDTDSSSQWIFDRILVTVINTAYDIISKKISSKKDVNTVFQFLFKTSKNLDEIISGFGKENLVEELNKLYSRYKEKRYLLNYFLK